MNLELLDFVIPFLGALIFLVIGRLWLTVVRRGQPLTRFMRAALVYGTLFVLGLGYLMMLAGNLHWSQTLLFTTLALWGGAVALFARWRYHKRKPDA